MRLTVMAIFGLPYVSSSISAFKCQWLHIRKASYDVLCFTVIEGFAHTRMGMGEEASELGSNGYLAAWMAQLYAAFMQVASNGWMNDEDDTQGLVFLEMIFYLMGSVEK